jgi:hypothetical protein
MGHELYIRELDMHDLLPQIPCARERLLWKDNTKLNAHYAM